MKPIRVLIIDDSAVVREVLGALVKEDPELELFGTAGDPIFAMEKTRTDWPDVIVLDIDMPRMDGITYLRKISAERPTPVVICSARAEKDASVTLEALALGAAEIITKPQLGLKDFLTESRIQIADAIKAAARSRPVSRAGPAARPESRTGEQKKGPMTGALAPGAALPKPIGVNRQCLIAIGASTGGTHAIEEILTGLPADSPAVLIVQHMPEKFTAAFAKRLNQHVPMEVREAQQGDAIAQGLALVAPGNFHMRLSASGRSVDIEAGPLVNRHRPAVDVLFDSVARLGPRAAGVLLTGMGDDGALGMLAMRRSGCLTIAQNRETSVVYGMPAEAVKLGAAMNVLGLGQIAGMLVGFARGEVGP